MSEWRDKAACKGQPLRKFYPSRVERAVSVADAVALCQQCPVVKKCAVDALYSAQEVGVCGVWAGVYLGDTPVWRGRKLKPLKDIAGPLAPSRPIANRHNPKSDDYVPTEAAIDHIERLWEMDMTNPAIAEAAGISLNTFSALIYDGPSDARIEVAGRTIRPRSLMTPAVEAAILSVPVPSEPVPRSRAPKAVVHNPGRCITCQEAMGSQKDRNWRGPRYGGKGRCGKCYQAYRRQRAEAAAS